MLLTYFAILPTMELGTESRLNQQESLLLLLLTSLYHLNEVTWKTIPHTTEPTVPGTRLQEPSFGNAGLLLQEVRARLSSSNSNVLHAPAPAPEPWWEAAWATRLGAGTPGGPLGGLTVFRHDAGLDRQREGVFRAQAKGTQAEENRWPQVKSMRPTLWSAYN